MRAHGLIKAREEGSSLLQKRKRGASASLLPPVVGKVPLARRRTRGNGVGEGDQTIFWPIRKAFCNDAKNLGMFRASREVAGQHKEE